MATKWFHQTSKGQQSLMVDSAELRRRAEAGIIRPDTLVRQSDSERWIRAQQVRGLFQQSTPAPSPAPAASPPGPPPVSVETKVAASNEKLATASLVCGIVALAYPGFITGPIGAVAAIVTGILGLRSEKRGRAIAGMVLAGLALAIFGILTYLELSTRRDLNDLVSDEQQAYDERWKSPVVSPAKVSPAAGVPSPPGDGRSAPVHAPQGNDKKPANAAADGVDRILRRARIHVEAREYDRAIAAYTQAIRLDPKNTLAYSGRGWAYHEEGDYYSAIANFTEAIWLDSEDAIAYRCRGRTYDKKGDYDSAIADFTEAIRLDPKDAVAYHYRGLAYQQKGQRAAAERDFAEAMRLGYKP